MAEWKGHMAATRGALLAAMGRATAAPETISQSDRVLFTACEFWASAMNDGLFSRLRLDAIAQLEAASAAFHVIGVHKVEAVLQRGQTALTSRGPLVSLQQVCESMQMELATMDEPVDRLLAEFAALHDSKSDPGLGR